MVESDFYHKYGISQKNLMNYECQKRQVSVPLNVYFILVEMSANLFKMKMR